MPRSGAYLSRTLSERFGVSLLRAAINLVCAEERFKYQFIRHDQALTATQVVSFEKCRDDHHWIRLYLLIALFSMCME
jgi:hypothetical protein